MDISKRIKQVRKDAGFTMRALSSLIGIPLQTINNYERGERPVSSEYIYKLYSYLNVNTNWLLSGKGEIYLSESEIESKNNVSSENESKYKKESVNVNNSEILKNQILLDNIIDYVETKNDENCLGLSRVKKKEIILLAYRVALESKMPFSVDIIDKFLKIAA